ncbi:hypothetical protein [Candidatus Uabimicrobium amorphum]|uniref:Uncharacterized protein n=1 Tax=Uabimicrobium amorphum TaxID=2596890 RepID=A0A5S9F0X3_UABAM|nr:hypothetical protein [Candidatus Uabimicrobium amorphum]BBM81812.1 hypothetical protein UABAM_00151 [Candidatus Uabimicrobium amorphum]
MLDFLIFDIIASLRLLDTTTNIYIQFSFLTLYCLGYFFTFVKLGYGKAAFALLFPIINLIIIFDFIEKPKWLILPWVLFAYVLFAYSIGNQAIEITSRILFWLVNFYISALLSLRVAQAFSKGKPFATFLFCFGSLGYISLAFFQVVGIKKGIVGKRRKAVPGARIT